MGLPVIIPKNIFLAPIEKITGADPTIFNIQTFETVGIKFPNRSEEGVQYDLGGESIEQRELTEDGELITDAFRRSRNGTITITANAWTFLMEALQRGYSDDAIKDDQSAKFEADAEVGADAAAIEGLNLDGGIEIQKFACLIEGRAGKDAGTNRRFYLIPKMLNKSEGISQSMNVQGVYKPAVTFDMMGLTEDELAPFQAIYSGVKRGQLIYPFYGKKDA